MNHASLIEFYSKEPYSRCFNKQYSLELMLILVESFRSGTELGIIELYEKVQYNKPRLGAFSSNIKYLEGHKILELSKGKRKKSVVAVRLCQDSYEALSYFFDNN